MNAHTTARGLGLFSIALGLAEVVATKRMSKFMRMEKRPNLLRMFGMREIATGVGILARKRRAPWVWARVAGDVMDLTAIGSVLVKVKKNRGWLAATAAAVAGVTALDIFCGRRLGKIV